MPWSRSVALAARDKDLSLLAMTLRIQHYEAVSDKSYPQHSLSSFANIYQLPYGLLIANTKRYPTRKT